MHRWLVVLIAFHCSVCFARADTLYYANGQTRATVGKTDDGSTMDGRYAERYENGQPRVTGTYRNGQPCGSWKYYDESGVLRRQSAQDDSTDFVLSRSGPARILQAGAQRLDQGMSTVFFAMPYCARSD